VALYAAPVLPETSDEVCRRLGVLPATTCEDLQREAAWGGLPIGNTVTIGEPLFPRLEVDRP
jgi:methionyl-tRNA synthetase